MIRVNNCHITICMKNGLKFVYFIGENKSVMIRIGNSIISSQTSSLTIWSAKLDNHFRKCLMLYLVAEIIYCLFGLKIFIVFFLSFTFFLVYLGIFKRTLQFLKLKFFHVVLYLSICKFNK